jgi:hypothetical protein
MDFDAIPEGDLTKKPFTSRISNLRKQQLNWLAMSTNRGQSSRSTQRPRKRF